MSEIRELVNEMIADSLTREEWEEMGKSRGWFEEAGLDSEPSEPTNGICRSGCPTQDHKSYADCLTDARIAIDKSSLKRGAR